MPINSKRNWSNRGVRFKDHDEWERCCNFIDECAVKFWGNDDMNVCAAKYVMILHKEFGASLKEAAKAHEAAREYLANHSTCKA